MTESRFAANVKVVGVSIIAFSVICSSVSVSGRELRICNWEESVEWRSEQEACSAFIETRDLWIIMLLASQSGLQMKTGWMRIGIYLVYEFVVV